MLFGFLNSLVTNGKPGPARNGGRVAAFVAGDATIFFPAIIALTSIDRQNSGKFDLFLCFSGADITKRQRAILRKYRITFLPADDLEQFKTAMAMPKMASGRWPAEVFLNWVLPETFRAMGYTFSLKVDYDILCVSPYVDLEAQLPQDRILRGLRTKKGRSPIPEPAARSLQTELAMPSRVDSSINAGVILFNNDLFAQCHFFETFHAIYLVLARTSSGPALLEQDALSIAAHGAPGGFYDLPSRYNCRVRYSARTEGFTPLIHNIHYISELKPWRPISPAAAKKLGAKGHGFLPYYRSIWLEYASTIEGFEEYCSERAFTAMETLALTMHVLAGAMQDKEKSLSAHSMHQ